MVIHGGLSYSRAHVLSLLWGKHMLSSCQYILQQTHHSPQGNSFDITIMASDQNLCASCEELLNYLPEAFDYFWRYFQMRAAQNKDSATASPVPVYKLGIRARSSRGLTCGFCKQLWRTRNLRYGGRRDDGNDRDSDSEESENSEAHETVQDGYDKLWICPFLECV